MARTVSMYNALFGVNQQSDIILATLGLTRASVGRFRDCFVSEGKIAVYTRNGGGNRECWHEGDPEYGNASCKNEPYQKVRPEYIQQLGSTAECGCNGGFTYLGIQTTHEHPTGQDTTETWYRCLEPNSVACDCPGCAQSYRLPAHPNFIRDEDDDFDSTYATNWFSFPPEFAEGLAKMDTGKSWEPDDRWRSMIDAISSVRSEN